jgi:hypothetical protein
MDRPEKLGTSQVVKKLPVPYGTRQVLPLDCNHDQFNLDSTLKFHNPTNQAAKEVRTENQAKCKSTFLRPFSHTCVLSALLGS